MADTNQDFFSMSAPEMLSACGDDARKWAEAFCQMKNRMGWSADDIEQGLMVAWFANAIEQACAVRAADR